MQTLDIAKGKRARGNWVHFKCMYCDDPSYHLGVNVDTGAVHCIRCGRTGLPSKYKVINSRPDAAEQLFGVDKADIHVQTLDESVVNENLVKTLGPDSVLYKEIQQFVLDTWPTLYWCIQGNLQTLWDYGVRVAEQGMSLYLPTYDGSYQLRKLSNTVKPKITGYMNKYPFYSPGMLAGNKPSDYLSFIQRLIATGDPARSHFVVTEGWADAACIPYPKNGLFLAGTPKGEETAIQLALLKAGNLTLCLDGDTAGRKTTAILSRNLAKLNVVHFVCLLLEGKDPANIGITNLNSELRRAFMVSSIKDALAWPLKHKIHL